MSTATSIVAFPVAGFPPALNRVRVISYRDRHTGTRSCPFPDKSSEVKRILGYARHDEGIATVDIDVVVQFDDPDFSGTSFGLALAIADKLSRFGEARHYATIVATGTISNGGSIEPVGSMAGKLETVDSLGADALLILPEKNGRGGDAIISLLRERGVEVRRASNLSDLADLWRPAPGVIEQARAKPTHLRWGVFWTAAVLGFLLTLIAASIVFSPLHQG
jgi:hypothetical protein